MIIELGRRLDPVAEEDLKSAFVIGEFILFNPGMVDALSRRLSETSNVSQAAGAENLPQEISPTQPPIIS